MTFLQKRLHVLVPGSFVTALLYSVFSLAFIISPYWAIDKNPTNRVLLLLVTVVLGLAWTAAAGSRLKVDLEPGAWLVFLILLAAMAAMNYRQLTGVIPWRGDEDFHIIKMISFASIVQRMGAWTLAGVAGYAVFLVLAWRKPKWAELAGALVTLGTAAYILEQNPFVHQFPYFLLRYPFFSYWFAVIAPAIGQAAGDPYHEVLYRLLPIIFAAALAWAFQHQIPSPNLAGRLLLGLSVATIPLVFYYSSIFYLEMPAVFLMLVVCFRIRGLLFDEVEQVKRSPAWYCLILIGFIKETTLPFLLCFLVSRWAVQHLKQMPWSPIFQTPESSRVEERKGSIFSRIAGEAGVAFVVLLPVVLYVILRNTYWPNGRAFGMQLANLVNPEAYIAFGKSFVEQFGVFLFFFLGGCFLLLKRKEYASVLFYLLAFVGIPLFHITDSWIFAGYSRFNLFVLPLVLAGSAVFLRWVYEHRSAAALVMAGAAIAASLAITPIRWDGSKEPYWDSYNVDTAEHYYPYREAIRWLKSTHPGEKTLIVGWTTDYFIKFYAEKYQWMNWEVLKRDQNIQNEPLFISRALAGASKENYPIVLVHVLSRDYTAPEKTSGYKVEKVVENSAHKLIIYRQGP